jgi:hypothetical protein
MGRLGLVRDRLNSIYVLDRSYAWMLAFRLLLAPPACWFATVHVIERRRLK